MIMIVIVVMMVIVSIEMVVTDVAVSANEIEVNVAQIVTFFVEFDAVLAVLRQLLVRRTLADKIHGAVVELADVSTPVLVNLAHVDDLAGGHVLSDLELAHVASVVGQHVREFLAHELGVDRVGSAVAAERPADPVFNNDAALPKKA